VRHAPAPIDAEAAGVRRLIRDAAVVDAAGEHRSLHELTGERPTAIVLTSASCPLCQKFGPELARLEDRWSGRVDFVWLNVSGIDDDATIAEEIERLGIDGAYVIDGRVSGELTAAAALDAQTTTEVFVVDAARTLVYRGAVSDRYGINYARASARAPYLEDALRAVSAGSAPAVPATSAPGCALDLPTAPASDPVTYHGRIARIVSDHCGACHRENGTAPFALDTYERVVRRAGALRFAIEERLMPPWFVESPAHGEALGFANDPSLSSAEREDLLAWLASQERPRGDAALHPLVPTYDDEWTIPTPDLVLALPGDVPIPADGVLDYVIRHVETGLSEDRWVRAIQILPTARANVHHALVVAVDREALAERRIGRVFRETNGFFGAYVPGNDAVVYPPGYARLLGGDEDLLFQMHYTTNGRQATDRTRIGLVFADEPPRHVVSTTGVTDRDLAIPPGAPRHAEAGRARVLHDVDVIAFLPHMHVRGSGFRYDVEREGTVRTLLDVPHYDFNWQLRYLLKEPLRLEAGSLVTAHGWFDNSERNPANPDPTTVVRFGEQTFDEMLIGYLEYTIDAGVDGPVFEHLRDAPIERFLGHFDANGDGIVEPGEVSESDLEYFHAFDHDGDGLVTPDDIDLAAS